MHCSRRACRTLGNSNKRGLISRSRVPYVQSHELWVSSMFGQKKNLSWIPICLDYRSPFTSETTDGSSILRESARKWSVFFFSIPVYDLRRVFRESKLCSFAAIKCARGGARIDTIAIAFTRYWPILHVILSTFMLIDIMKESNRNDISIYCLCNKNLHRNVIGMNK